MRLHWSAEQSEKWKSNTRSGIFFSLPGVTLIVTSQTSYSPEYITQYTKINNVERTSCVYIQVFSLTRSVGNHPHSWCTTPELSPLYSPARAWSFGKFRTIFDNHSVTRSIIPNNRRRTERKESLIIICDSFHIFKSDCDDFCLKVSLKTLSLLKVSFI